jgi:hypothetical protein
LSVGFRDWKKRGRYRWRESLAERRERRDDLLGPPLILHISRFTLHVPPKGFPGLLLAALPLALVIAILYSAWRELLVLSLVIALTVFFLLRRSPR